jgi:hypothetical protein
MWLANCKQELKEIFADFKVGEYIHRLCSDSESFGLL